MKRIAYLSIALLFTAQCDDFWAMDATSPPRVTPDEDDEYLPLSIQERAPSARLSVRPGCAELSTPSRKEQRTADSEAWTCCWFLATWQPSFLYVFMSLQI
jgi:hypothetical protein